MKLKGEIASFGESNQEKMPAELIVEMWRAGDSYREIHEETGLFASEIEATLVVSGEMAKALKRWNCYGGKLTEEDYQLAAEGRLPATEFKDGASK